MDTKELIRNIHRLEITTKAITRQLLSGRYHSAFKGRGMAFSEVREYTIGDEVRTIDWNVTARYSTPFIKVFEEERELNVILVVDLSASTFFGTQSKTKRELAIETAAILAFSAVANNDKIGLVIFSDDVERYLPPQKGRKQALNILRELMDWNPKGKGTRIEEALKFVRTTQKKRSVVVFLSDFMDEHDYLNSMRLTKKHHDLIAIQLADQGEQIIPSMGCMEFINAETAETSWVNSSDELQREQVNRAFEEHAEWLSEVFRKSGIDFISCFTHQDIIQPLVQLFHRRS
jgi:uncharacterized protein (DUF58 family)